MTAPLATRVSTTKYGFTPNTDLHLLPSGKTTTLSSQTRRIRTTLLYPPLLFHHLVIIPKAPASLSHTNSTLPSDSVLSRKAYKTRTYRRSIAARHEGTSSGEERRQELGSWHGLKMFVAMLSKNAYQWSASCLSTSSR